jgi:two-component system NtrC family response regulator
MVKLVSKILVIDDEEYIGWVIEKAFETTDNEVSKVLTGDEGVELFKKQTFDMVFLDLRLPDMDGMDILVELKRLRPNIAVIVITAHGSIDTAIESMKKGAFNYLTKPFDVDELILQAQKALEVGRLKQEVNYLREEASKEANIHIFSSNNAKMDWIYKSLNQIADTSATVLITGESGVGKEIIARRIHKLSHRKDYPFIAFNCAALSEKAVEIELFGDENGKLGKFELAHKGTIFLDEVGEMNLNIQANLLRVLEEREFQRVGGNSNIKVDIRIIAATNKDLKEAIEKAEFREDFYYRLNVIPIELPPLRERKEDIKDLIKLFIKKYDIHGKIESVTPEAEKLLRSYHWPGNIRELENVIERIVILNKDTSIKADSLPIDILDQRKKSKEPIIYFPEEGINLEEVERELLIKALKLSEQNQTKAAQLLGITRSALIYRMQKYQL